MATMYEVYPHCDDRGASNTADGKRLADQRFALLSEATGTAIEVATRTGQRAMIEGFDADTGETSDTMYAMPDGSVAKV